MKRQLDFGTIVPAFRDIPGEYAERTERILAAARRVVEYNSFDWAAQALGRRQAVISQALHPDPKQRNGNHLWLEHAAPLIARAPNVELVNTLTEISEPEFGAEETLTALVDTAFEMLGRDVHRLLRVKTHERLLASRRKAAR